MNVQLLFAFVKRRDDKAKIIFTRRGSVVINQLFKRGNSYDYNYFDFANR